MKPRKLSQVEFLSLLDDLRMWVRTNDSMEGYLTYEWSDEPGTYDVVASLRVGNSQGQGGVRMVGEHEDHVA